MRNNSIKIYLLGFSVWLILCIVSFGIWCFTAYVPYVAQLTFTGKATLTQLPPFSKVVIQVEGKELHCFDDKRWFVITGDSAIVTPQLRMPSDMSERVTWDASDGVLTLTINLSDIESSGVTVETTSPACLILPACDALAVSALQSCEVLKYISLEKLNVSHLSLDIVRRVSVENCRIDSLSLSAVNHDTYLPYNLIIRGSEIGYIGLTVPEGDCRDVNMDIEYITRGTGGNSKQTGSVGKLYVSAEGNLEVNLTCSGSLADKIEFAPGLNNTLQLMTGDSYIVESSPEN